MPTGFGTGPPGPRGIRADPPEPNTADDLHDIKLRFCGPQTLNVQNVGLVANQAQRFDLTGTPVNAIILTTNTGQINGYFGDYTSGSGKAAVVPHFVGSAAIAPNTEVIAIPPGENYIITVQEGTGAAGGATGTIVFCYQ